MQIDDVHKRLNELVEMSLSHFHADSITPQSQREYELEGLGMTISQWTGGSHREILTIFIAALEDANAHDLAEALRQLFDRRYPIADTIEKVARLQEGKGDQHE